MSDVEAPLLTLTPDEEVFALGVIECAGNIGKAYENAFGEITRYPVAQARVLLNQPHIAARVAALESVQSDVVLLTLTSHLVELASIRDLAKKLQAVKVALDAERSRGEVMGLYNKTADFGDPTESRVNAVRATLKAALAVTEQ